jgi:hypothetical protein
MSLTPFTPGFNLYVERQLRLNIKEFFKFSLLYTFLALYYKGYIKDLIIVLEPNTLKKL